ncbi:MAG: molybdopterin-dependent oxidoreductase [Xanthobacteraceae bacterium]
MNASAAPSAVHTTCPYCGVGCGVLVTSGADGLAISGDPEHPANFGRLCSKGSALGETLGLSGRLLHPLARGADGAYAQIDWADALDRVAAGFRSIIERDGPDAVAFYLSGQLLTEDYYVANKLMKGFIGSANVDTNSRLCMASSVAGHRRAFGTDVVPCSYEDLDCADLIVLVGSNAAWCHPVLFQRMVTNRRARGAKLVVIDPRRTPTADEADLFLPVAPGADTALFCGLLAHLADNDALDLHYIDAHTTGFENALARARAIAPDASATAAAAGVPVEQIKAFFALFRATERAVTAFSQGVNQSAQGTDKVNAIINCHLATGRIGRSGQGPFSLTGQPNAMGGREVGGLANQLAAHMDYSPAAVDRVRRFWRAPRMANREGLKAVAMFEAIERGEIKALWVMGTNPAVSLPRAGAARAALQKLDLFVLAENVVRNDTVEAGPHLLLPAAAWGEKDGTVTNSERCVSRQRPFMPLPGEAKPDWWMVTEVARRLGFASAFGYRSAADVFREHAALSAFENDGTRDFDLGGLADLGNTDYDRLAPVQWPLPAGTTAGTRRFFSDGGFYTPDRKAKFVAPESPAPREALSATFPFRLNTGRVRDQWHTMTRTGLSPRLAAHSPEPFVEVHPADAAAAGLHADGFAAITSAHGSCVLKVLISEGQRRGSLFAPIHWSDATAAFARVGNLVAPITDPFSGQPEAKATPVAITPVEFRYAGFALSREAVAPPPDTWCARVAVEHAAGLVFAGNQDFGTWRDWALAAFGADAELVEYSDERRNDYRLALFRDRRIDACLFVGAADAKPQWDTVKAYFSAPSCDEVERRYLLSGRSPDGVVQSGPIICACFGVGLTTIHAAMNTGARSVEAIGAALKAGTNCGSCVPELRRLVATPEAASVR